MEFKPVKGYEGYYKISENGEVWSEKRTVKYSDGRVRHYDSQKLKIKKNEAGYIHVNLTKDTVSVNFAIHRLVALTFLGEPNQCVNHKDGNKKNNHFSNLEWCTYAHNNKHARDTGLNTSKAEWLQKYNNEKKCKILMISNNKAKAFSDSKECAEYLINKHKLTAKLETIARTIRMVCNGKRNHAYNYKFQYIDV